MEKKLNRGLDGLWVVQYYDGKKLLAIGKDKSAIKAQIFADRMLESLRFEEKLRWNLKTSKSL